MLTTSFVSDKPDKRSKDLDMNSKVNVDFHEQKRVTIVDHKSNDLQRTRDHVNCNDRTRDSPKCNDIQKNNISSNDLKHKVTPCDDLLDKPDGNIVNLDALNFNIPTNFKTHQKRSSYHLMQELNLEDSGSSNI